MTNCSRTVETLLRSHMGKIDRMTGDDDARQRGYIALWNKAKSYDPALSDSFWKYACREVRSAVFQPPDCVADGDRVPDRAGPDTTGEVDTADWVARLPADLRLIAEGLLEGSTQEEIAEELGLTQQAVSYRVVRLRELAARRYDLCAV